MRVTVEQLSLFADEIEVKRRLPGVELAVEVNNQ